ncbi:MAG: alpha-ketoglutarate-dependent taurine dioxygenase [Dokdonia sp.]|jgi:alpha-ketoglutarate-dependent taurine dioxygenase
MLCVRPSEEGGESLFVSLSDLITNLPDALLAILTTKQWRFNTANHPIITQTPTGPTICYNRLMMESYAELTQQELDLLDQLDRMCDQLTFRVKLKANDLIVFRNDLFLHGRTDFSLDSNRLLKRVRFREPASPAGRSV